MNTNIFKSFVFVFLVIFLLSTSVYSKTDIEFIVDLSGSMRKASGGETQIETARKALIKTLSGIPADTFIALRVYGHRVEQTNKAESCKDTELTVPFGKGNKEQLKSKIEALKPKGYTPIALSLEKSKGDFSVEREADKVIILLSDGEETCGGDPVAVLKKLKEEGFKVVVHTVGFNVDEKTRKQLQDISSFTGGKYFDAKGADQLTKSLEEATQVSLVLDKEKKTYGNEIRGGNSYETAVVLEYDKEYKLDHHQKKKDYDYFYVDLAPGQELAIQMNTLEKGVNLRGEKPVENAMPYGGLELHGAERTKIKGDVIIGSAHTMKKVIFSAQKEGKYYILVGNTYDDQNKDHFTFKLTSAVKGDLGESKDAGADPKVAMKITPGRYEKNYLGGGDVSDYFSITAKKGDKYFVGVIPNDNFKDAYFTIFWINEYKQKLLNTYSKYGEGMKTDVLTLPDDGTYYLQIGLSGTKKTAGSYTLDLKKVEDSPPATSESPSN